MILRLTEGPIELMPQTTVEEVMQNVRMIVGVRKGTVPIDREFGLDATVVDKPMGAATALLSAQLAKDIPKFEPRARLVSLTTERTADGVLEPIIRIAIAEGG